MDNSILLMVKLNFFSLVYLLMEYVFSQKNLKNKWISFNVIDIKRYQINESYVYK
jgi:hypothetical protein